MIPLGSSFEAIAAVLSDALLMVDSEGAITHVNARAVEWLGGAPLGRKLDELCDEPDRMAEYLRYCRRSSSALPGGFAVGGARFRCRAAGFEREGAGRSVVVRFFRPESDDEFVLLRQTIEQLNDEITRRKQAAAELEAAIRVRDDFLAVAGHELKTPLTSLQLQLTSLSRAATKAGIEPLIATAERASRSAARLARLADELLEVSHLSEGRLSLDRVLVDLSALVVEVLARLSPDTGQLRVTAEPGVTGHWDPTRLEQVVTNLVANALKFGRGAPVDVVVESAGPIARLSVRDRGIGIAPEAHERIFQKFQRAIASKNFGGIGLGLWISREIVGAHGGTLSVESQLGEGATFTVILPR